MSTQRFTPEFKQEAVRQVVDRGYSVAGSRGQDRRFGHSLYKWVKSVSPDKSEKQARRLARGQERDPEAARAAAAHRRRTRHSKKSRAVLCQGARVKYRFINDHRHEHGVATMCRVLQVARAGFYEWLHKPLSNRASRRSTTARSDSRLVHAQRRRIRFTARVRRSARSRRNLWQTSRGSDHAQSTRSAPYGATKRRGTSPAGHRSSLPIGSAGSSPSTRRISAWVTDITYIRTWQGWLYLAVVMDLLRQQGRGLVDEAHARAGTGSGRAADGGVAAQTARRVVVHSDQGTQYGSDDWSAVLPANNLEPSMSSAEHERRGNCWDNAVAESFFSSLKKERIRKRIYKTRELARADVFDYIEVFLQSNPPPQPLGRRQSRGLRTGLGVRLGIVCQTRSIYKMLFRGAA